MTCAIRLEFYCEKGYKKGRGYTMHEFVQMAVGWLLEYGGPILFLMLVLGIVGLPIPDETLLTLSGWLIAKGQLNPISTVLFAIVGSICGITISYWLGRNTGTWLLKKYGPKFKFTEKRVQHVHRWYERIGKWSLVVGYFVPLVRHLTGYVAGSLQLTFKEFAIFAYAGALIWSLLFLGLGYFLLVEILPPCF